MDPGRAPLLVFLCGDFVGSGERGSCSEGRLGQSIVVAIGAALWLVFAGSRDR